MRELVLVLTSPTSRGVPRARSETLHGGWRRWIAAWAGRGDLADASLARVAAIHTPVEGASGLWLATPVHLIAGLTDVHVASAGVQLTPGEAAELAASFARSFASEGLVLTPVAAGFLLSGLMTDDVTTHDPARAEGTSLSEWLPTGEGAAKLRRLGSEIELWLYEHAVNRQRAARNELPVTALWLWGGSGVQQVERKTLPMAFAAGDDPFLRGLWAACDAPVAPAMRDPAALDTLAFERAVVVVSSSGSEDRADVDRWLAAVAKRPHRRMDRRRVRVLLNDRVFHPTRYDAWWPWR